MPKDKCREVCKCMSESKVVCFVMAFSLFLVIPILALLLNLILTPTGLDAWIWFTNCCHFTPKLFDCFHLKSWCKKCCFWVQASTSFNWEFNLNSCLWALFTHLTDYMLLKSHSVHYSLWAHDDQDTNILMFHKTLSGHLRFWY